MHAIPSIVREYLAYHWDPSLNTDSTTKRDVLPYVMQPAVSTPYGSITWAHTYGRYVTNMTIAKLSPQSIFSSLIFQVRSQNCENRVLASVMSVRPSVRMEQLGSHWTDLDETWYLNIFRKSVHKIQVSLNPKKNNGYFTWRRFHIYDNISLNSS